MGPELDQQRRPPGLQASLGDQLGGNRAQTGGHRRGRAHPRPVRVQYPRVLRVEHRQEQLVLALEVGVHRTFAVAGPLGDLLHRRQMESPRQKLCAGRGHQLTTGLLLALIPA